MCCARLCLAGAMVGLTVLLLSAAAGAAEPPDGSAEQKPNFLDAFPEKKLLRVLTTADEPTRLVTVQKLYSYGDYRPVAELLVKALRKVHGSSSATRPSTVEMLLLLSQFTDHAELRDVMRLYLDCSHFRAVMVAVDTLGELGDLESLEKIIGLADSPHFGQMYGFRKCIFQALMKLEDPRSIELMLKRLPQLRGQLEYDLVRYLSHVSRQRFATDAELWSTWWKDNAQDFHFTETQEKFTLEAAPPDDFAWDRPVAEFFGTYIYAKRLVFVLDISSSMTKKVGEATRVAVAKRELAEAIKKLPEDTHFSMLFFDADIARWNRKLVPANQANRQRAVEWVVRTKAGQGTASYDALDEGFGVDGNTEAVFFLSDGRPSRGKITDPDDIVRIVTKENYFRRIAVYTFGFDTGGGGGERFMRALAKRNQGFFKAIK